MPPALLIANNSGRAGVFSNTFRSSILICYNLKNKIHLSYLPLSVNPGKNPKRRFSGKKSRAKHSIICYVSVLWIFPGIAFGDGPKNRHVFFLSTAYLLSNWHMPFHISIIR